MVTVISSIQGDMEYKVHLQDIRLMISNYIKHILLTQLETSLMMEKGDYFMYVLVMVSIHTKSCAMTLTLDYLITFNYRLMNHFIQTCIHLANRILVKSRWPSTAKCHNPTQKES